MKKIFKKIVGFKNKLTRLSNEEPVTKLALVIIILLDIFILSIIFSGLDDHTAQLTSPADYFPYQCKQVFITKDWTPANKIDKLQTLALTDYNNYSYRHNSPFEKSKIDKMHPVCGKFYEQIKVIANNKELKDLFINRQQAIKKKQELTYQYNMENEVYDTKLLEDIAGKDSHQLKSVSESFKDKSQAINSLNIQIKTIDKKLNSNPLVLGFWEISRPGDESFRETLINDINKFERIYLFKELMWQLLFLLPLLAIFIVWHSRSVNKDSTIQSLISAHLIVVAAIPIVLKSINVVVELIPFHFFKNIFEVLEKFHIIALWHYGVIIVAIAVAILCVFIIQKKIFNKQRLYEKRLIKGACYSCGKTLPRKQTASCPFCGTKQFTECTKCHNDTYISGKFCIKCGQQQNNI